MSKRVTVHVSDSVDNKITKLATQLEVNKSETLRRLIGIGLVILREERLGNKVQTVDKDGKAIQMVFPDL